MLKESEFHVKERQGWEQSAPGYLRGFARLTIQAGMRALQVVGAGPGKRLLDAACGPGNVTALAAQVGAQAVGVDFSREMIHYARRQHPGGKFLVGDVLDLPLVDESFDCVVMDFVIHHLEFPERALGQIFNKLKPGGKVAFTHWARADQAVLFGFMNTALQRHRRDHPARPPGSSFDRFNDPIECQRFLIACDFVHPQVEMVPQIWRLDTPDEAYEAMLTGTVRIRSTLAAQTPEIRFKIFQEVVEQVSDYRVGEYIELPMPAMLSWAEKC